MTFSRAHHRFGVLWRGRIPPSADAMEAYGDKCREKVISGHFTCPAGPDALVKSIFPPRANTEVTAVRKKRLLEGRNLEQIPTLNSEVIRRNRRNGGREAGGASPNCSQHFKW